MQLQSNHKQNNSFINKGRVKVCTTFNFNWTKILLLMIKILKLKLLKKVICDTINLLKVLGVKNVRFYL